MNVHFEKNLNYDLGHLLLTDINSVSSEGVEAAAQENIKSLLAKLHSLPIRETSSAVLLKLPAPLTVVPRAAPPPKQSRLTAWDKFRLQKGLGKRPKRSRMVYDRASDDWHPRWGPYSIKKLENKRETILEERGGEDPFEKRKKERELKRLHHKKQEVKNQLSAALEGKKDKKGVLRALELAKSSTPSLSELPQKRSRPRAETSVSSEKQHNLAILRSLKKTKS